MISEEEYGKLLKYLVNRLNQLSLDKIVDEINRFLGSGKTEVAKSNEDLKEQKIKIGTIGKTEIVPFSQEEAFKLAIEYLRSIMVEVPKYKEKIQKEFGYNIIWELDQAKNFEDVLEGQSFSIDTISFQGKELENIIQIFEDLLEQKNNNGNL